MSATNAAAQVASDQLVWAATRRTGLDFHDLDAGRTGCGRSTHSTASIKLTLAEATAGGMRPCPRCWPLGLPARCGCPVQIITDEGHQDGCTLDQQPDSKIWS